MRHSNIFIVANFLLLTGATEINGNSQTSSMQPSIAVTDVKGRLLTPQEGCGFSGVHNTRIIGGSPAKIGAWPWLALLAYKIKKKIKFGCGGSLITSRHVLSAAHCMFYSLRFVRLGEHDTTTTTDGEHQDVSVVDTEIHEFFSVKWKINDIAVVYLAHDVTFNARVRPICLPVNGPILNRRFVDSTPFLAGWGMVDEDVEEMSPILMQVQVPVITNTQCMQSYQKFDDYDEDFQFDDRVVCAGYANGGKDSCQGDSGGPLMLPVHENGSFPFYQIGVVSHAEGCAQANVPGINTNVQYFAEWIEEKLTKDVDGFNENI